MAPMTSLVRESLARFWVIQSLRLSTRGLLRAWRTVLRSSALLPLMSRSMANRASMRWTASRAMGEMNFASLPAALRRALAAISANSKNFLLACAQQAASIMGPGVRPGS
jgi:hypothetical protein